MTTEPSMEVTTTFYEEDSHKDEFSGKRMSRPGLALCLSSVLKYMLLILVTMIIIAKIFHGTFGRVADPKS